MPEIEIDFKPKIFDDSHLCEDYHEKCGHMQKGNSTTYCLLFRDDTGFKVISNEKSKRLKKHKECKEHWERVKKRIKKVCPDPECGSNHIAFSGDGNKARCIYCGWKGTVDELKQKGA